MNVSLNNDIKSLIKDYFDSEFLVNEDRFAKIPEICLVRQKAWAEKGHKMSHQEWKGLCCKVSLENMALWVDSRHQLVGCLDFHDISEKQQAELDTLIAKTEENITPFPGGDNGHNHPDFERIFELGIPGYIKLINSYLEKNPNNEKTGFYKSCLYAMEGVIAYISRCGEKCKELAENGENKERFIKLAKICDNLTKDAPKTFYEAIQLMCFVIYALWFGEDHSQTNPGRMDRTLISFYENDIKNGEITEQEAFELICNLFIHLNYMWQAGGAISVNVGGRDKDGNIIQNALTYLCIEARVQTSLVYPTVGLAWADGMSDELMTYATKTLVKGVGCPAIFNDHIISLGLKEAGVSPEDSENWMNSTCVELRPVGASNIWVATPYYNCSQHLLDVMKDIKDGKVKAENIDDVNMLLEKSLSKEVGEQAKFLDEIWENRKTKGLFPLLSCWTKDCLERGLDYDNGGARYNWVECSFVGLANVSDAIYALNKLVFVDKKWTVGQLYDILSKNFEGYEDLYKEIENMPKYGNDIEEVDKIAKFWFENVAKICRSYSIGGHEYEPGTFCWIMHEYLGRQTGATLDGRRAGLAFADGSGSAQGRDVCGPTSSILSTTKWAHKNMVGGMVQNIRFSKSTFQKESDYEALKALIITYLKRGGFEIQVNMTSKEELLDAQIHPENHKNLVVRVAGYSDYFTHLNPNMQKEVISRMEHEF